MKILKYVLLVLFLMVLTACEEEAYEEYFYLDESDSYHVDVSKGLFSSDENVIEFTLLNEDGKRIYYNVKQSDIYFDLKEDEREYVIIFYGNQKSVELHLRQSNFKLIKNAKDFERYYGN